jgi:hypothetical protein
VIPLDLQGFLMGKEDESGSLWTIAETGCATGKRPPSFQTIKKPRKMSESAVFLALGTRPANKGRSGPERTIDAWLARNDYECNDDGQFSSPAGPSGDDSSVMNSLALG